MEYPPSIPIEELKPSCCYDADKLRKYFALYEAGSTFRAMVDEFLVKRKIEELGGDNGRAHYNERVKRAWYIPRGSDLVDFLTAAAFRDDLRIEATGPNAEEYNLWNEDADGLGTPLSTLARDAMRETLLFNRAYFWVNFPSSELKQSDPATRRANLGLISALAADDWQHGDDGTLKMLRVHTSDGVRDPIAFWKQPEIERHAWCFHTAEDTAVYTATRKYCEKSWNAGALATLRETPFTHAFGTMPVFDVRTHRGSWVMERIYDPLLGLFNREVSLTFALDLSAYSLLVLKLDPNSDISKVVASELAALRLNANAQEGAGFISPDQGIYEGLFRDVERWKQGLYEVFRALTVNAAATQTQNARQSADAKRIDREPLEILLASLADPVINAVKRAVLAVKKHRGDNGTAIEVKGAATFNKTMGDVKEFIQNTQGAQQDATGYHLTGNE